MSSETQAGGGQGRPAALPSGDRDKALALLRSGRSVVSVSKELELPEESVRKLARDEEPGGNDGTSGNGGGTDRAPAARSRRQPQVVLRHEFGEHGCRPAAVRRARRCSRATATRRSRCCARGVRSPRSRRSSAPSEESIRKLERTPEAAGRRPAGGTGASRRSPPRRHAPPSPRRVRRPSHVPRLHRVPRPVAARVPSPKPARPAPAPRPAPRPGRCARVGAAATATAVADDEPAPGPYHEIGRKVTPLGPARAEVAARTCRPGGRPATTGS